MWVRRKNSKRVEVWTQEVPPTAMQRRIEFLLVSSPDTTDDSLFEIPPTPAHPPDVCITLASASSLSLATRSTYD